MMLLGTTRDTSKWSGCQFAVGGTGSTGSPPIYFNGALYDLAYNTLPLTTFDPCMGHYSMLADHLTNTDATCTTPPCPCSNPHDRTTCTNQEAVAAISPFINT